MVFDILFNRVLNNIIPIYRFFTSNIYDMIVVSLSELDGVIHQMMK